MERPILFSAPMVRALLAGTKTQTRRVVDALLADRIDHCPGFLKSLEGIPSKRFGQAGDRLWVRETWQVVSGNNRARRICDNPRPDFGWVEYAATPRPDEPAYKWRPSIHMPRWASRITLEVTGVRVERLQDISEADAIAEGVNRFPGCRQDDDAAAFNRIGPVDNDSFPIARYAVLWESINGPGSWGANPWVWCVAFRRVAEPSNVLANRDTEAR